MPKRRRILLILAWGVTAGAIPILLLRQEPSYNGRGLSSWMGIRGKEANYQQPSDYEEAMRHMGTNAIPYIFRWMVKEDPPWRQRFREKVEPIAEKFGITIPPRRTFGPSVFACALSLVGPDAEVAIPRLSSL